jgi:hypothetical protein
LVERLTTKYCSSGFSVLLGGTAYMATAGHCFNLGVSLGDGGSPPSAYGTVAFRNWGNPGDLLDTEFIGGAQYGGYIWLGTDPYNPSWAHVISAGNPGVGSSYCSSGYVTTELCGLVATGVGVYACDPNGHCTGGMVRFSGEHWTIGDSGGPIFVKYTNPLRAAARATIIGKWDGSSYGQQWSAIAGAFGTATICTQSNGAC